MFMNVKWFLRKPRKKKDVRLGIPVVVLELKTN
jgi:hypothetical protein